MYPKEAASIPDERNKLDVYKLRNDIAVQLLEASGIAIIVITCIILHIYIKFEYCA